MKILTKKCEPVHGDLPGGMSTEVWRARKLSEGSTGAKTKEMMVTQDGIRPRRQETCEGKCEGNYQ